MKSLLITFFLLSAAPVAADIMLAARTIRPGEIIMVQDLVVREGDLIGTASHASQLTGSEARVTLYAGRPIALADVGPPALVPTSVFPSIKQQ